MRLYDKVVRMVDYNHNSGHIVLLFANPIFSGIYSTQQGQLYWQLPITTKDLGHPVAMKSDMDKLLICYDTNKIVVYDTLNLKLHQWSVDNLHKLPSNFLNRYNRILGIV